MSHLIATRYRAVHSSAWNLRPWIFLAAFLYVLVAPVKVHAHGELLIRIAAVTKQIEASTNNLAPLFLQRGELYREDENWSAAESDYAQAQKLGSNPTTVDFCRAKLLADSGRLEEARAMFDKVVRESPNDGEVLIGRARVLVRSGKIKDAIEDYRNGLKVHLEPQPEYYLELAQSLGQEGQTEEALQSLDEGMGKFGPIVPLQRYAVELNLQQKEYDKALRRLDTIIEFATRKEDWLAQQGDILLLARRPVDARKAYKASLKAIDLLPKRLQQSPSMLKLQSRIHAAMAEIKTAPDYGND